MLSTSENVMISGHNHLLITGADDPTLQLSPEHQSSQFNSLPVQLIKKPIQISNSNNRNINTFQKLPFHPLGRYWESMKAYSFQDHYLGMIRFK